MKSRGLCHADFSTTIASNTKYNNILLRSIIIIVINDRRVHVAAVEGYNVFLEKFTFIDRLCFKKTALISVRRRL